LREAYTSLTKDGATIVAIAPDSVSSLQKHLRTNTYPFPVLADPDGKTFDAYDVTSRLMALGQQPALFIVDSDGIVRFDAVGKNQWDLVSPADLAAELAKLAKL
jgi:peroxiredoxin